MQAKTEYGNNSEILHCSGYLGNSQFASSKPVPVI